MCVYIYILPTCYIHIDVYIYVYIYIYIYIYPSDLRVLISRGIPIDMYGAKEGQTSFPRDPKHSPLLKRCFYHLVSLFPRGKQQLVGPVQGVFWAEGAFPTLYVCMCGMFMWTSSGCLLGRRRLSNFVCMYVWYVFVCMCVWIGFWPEGAFLYVCLCMYVCVCMCVVYVWIGSWPEDALPSVYVCMCVCICVCMYVCCVCVDRFLARRRPTLCVCMYVCICVCVCVCACACINMCVYICACVCVCI